MTLGRCSLSHWARREPAFYLPRPPSGVSLGDKLLELEDPLGLAHRHVADAKIQHGRLQKLGRGEGRIKHHAEMDSMCGEMPQQPAQQGGLPSARFAREDHESLV